MEAQQRISLPRNQAQVGRTLDVLVEGTGQLKGGAAWYRWRAATVMRPKSTAWWWCRANCPAARWPRCA